jgi:hypothetical protein
LPQLIGTLSISKEGAGITSEVAPQNLTDALSAKQNHRRPFTVRNRRGYTENKITAKLAK